MSDLLPNAHSTLQQPQQQQQQQSHQSGGGQMHGGVMNLSLPQQQIILALRNQVQQGNMTHQQALDRLAMMQASARSFQEQSVQQQLPPGFNAGAMPSGTPQQQQQQNDGSGIASRMGQNLNPSGMDLPQGPGSLQQNFIQPSPSFHHANPQPSSTPSASQIPQPVSSSPGNLADVPLPQLRALATQLLHVVMEGERNLQATSSSGEGDIQRQQLRAKIELNKQRLRVLHEVINVKMRASGDPTQQTVNGPHPASQPPINKLPPLTEDRFNSNFMQFTRSKGIRLSERDLIIDDRRINLWALHRTVFSRNGFDSVSARDEWPAIGAALGFPPVGGDPGRPPRCGTVIAQRLQQLYNDVLRHFDQVYISSIIARLRNSQASGQLPPWIIARLSNSQASGQLPPWPPQPQVQLHQPTEADYQALLVSITPETSVMNTETMSILPRFSHTSCAELEAHHVPQHVITFVEQNREHLQRAAQDQNGFRPGLTSKPITNAQLDNRTQVDYAPALQACWYNGDPTQQTVNGPSWPPPPASSHDPPQWDDSEPAQSPEGAMSHCEGLFDEEVEIAMSRLEI